MMLRTWRSPNHIILTSPNHTILIKLTMFAFKKLLITAKIIDFYHQTSSLKIFSDATNGKDSGLCTRHSLRLSQKPSNKRPSPAHERSVGRRLLLNFLHYLSPIARVLCLPPPYPDRAAAVSLPASPATSQTRRQCHRANARDPSGHVSSLR
jgi:hypothetical protein